MGISLAKGQTVSLAKSANGRGLTQVQMGLGWDAKVMQKRGLFGRVTTYQRDIDLDASALLFAGGKVADIVYFGNLKSKDGSIVHTGDNRSGAGDGESILVDLTRVPANVEHIVFIVNSYSGESFSEIDNAYVRVVDSTDGDTELMRYTITGSGPHTALVMGRVSRTPSGWEFTAIGAEGAGRTADQLVPLARRSLG